MKINLKIFNIIFYLLSSSFLYSSHAISAEIAKESNLGITFNEAKKKFPNAIPPNAENSMASGSIEKLHIYSTKIAGNDKFETSFFFKNDRLTEIMHSLDQKESTEITKRILNRLSNRLTNQYGEADHSENNSIAGSTSITLEWKNEKSDIILFYSDINNKYPLLNYIYVLPSTP